MQVVLPPESSQRHVRHSALHIPRTSVHPMSTMEPTRMLSIQRARSPCNSYVDYSMSRPCTKTSALPTNKIPQIPSCHCSGRVFLPATPHPETRQVGASTLGTARTRGRSKLPRCCAQSNGIWPCTNRHEVRIKCPVRTREGRVVGTNQVRMERKASSRNHLLQFLLVSAGSRVVVLMCCMY